MNARLAYLQTSKQRQKEIKAFLKKIKKGKNLDELFHHAHEEVFSKTNCLHCANCCKTTSPIFRDSDIRRIAKHLKVKEVKFISDYLRIDEDSDYVLKSSPCYFLGEDNACSIYEHRPLACREYPHTNRKNMHQIMELTERNTQVCPAVAEIVLKLME
ncbi:MAG: YkgJ family cysteine cluster protein [Flavobacteriales bacterium]|jgi:Fe-S-cluster containining protein